MQIKLCRPSELSIEQIARWRQLIEAHPPLQHPQLAPDWARVIEEARWPIEIADFDDNGVRGFFAFARKSPHHAGPVAGHFSDRQAFILPVDVAIDGLSLIQRCGLKSYVFDHVSIENRRVARFQYQTDSAYEVQLSQNYSHYWNELQSQHRSWCQQIERKRRKLVREVGPLRFELHTEADDAWQALLDWKQQQVLAAGLRNLFSDDKSRRLMQQTVRHQSNFFAGWLSALYAGRQLVAVHLGQRSGNYFNAWIPAYHPEFAPYSPGALLHLEMFRRCLDEGVSEIDLGRGVNPLKQTLATKTTELGIGAIDGRRWSRIAIGAKFRLKKWLHRSRPAAPFISLYRHIRNKLNSN